MTLPTLSPDNCPAKGQRYEEWLAEQPGWIMCPRCERWATEEAQTICTSCQCDVAVGELKEVLDNWRPRSATAEQYDQQREMAKVWDAWDAEEEREHQRVRESNRALFVMVALLIAVVVAFAFVMDAIFG